PLAEVYGFWRRLQNLPQFMAHLDAVTEGSDGQSHWVAIGPAGLAIEWDAEIINEIENKLIAWRLLPGSDVVTAGPVIFHAAPAGRKHRSQRASAIRATRREGRSADRVALRRRAVSDHPRGSAALQTASRSGRDSASNESGGATCVPSAGKAKRRSRSRRYRTPSSSIRATRSSR